MSKLKTLIKDYVPKPLLKKVYRFLSLVKIPNNPHSVTSDLFPFRITDNWDTYFELLNLPAILDPMKDHKPYNVKFIFFDEEGNFIHQFDLNNEGIFRNTINISEKLKAARIEKNGTFACFHECYLPWLISSDAFLAERGYVGYQNNNISKTRSYVHGNFDAISKDNKNNLTCLGTTNWKERVYNLQYELMSNAAHELAFVNSSEKTQKLQIEIMNLNSIESSKPKTVEIKIPSKGVFWLKEGIDESNHKRIIIKSHLNLARPIVFKSSNNNFDVFHG